MRQTQKTLLEKARPVFKKATQPIFSAAARPWDTGVQYTNKCRQVCGMPKASDQENRRLSHDHKVRLSDDEEAAFQEFLAAFDLSAQDFIRGLINGKLRLDNDGLAAMLQCMHARR